MPHADTQRMIEIWRAVWDVGGVGEGQWDEIYEECDTRMLRILHAAVKYTTFKHTHSCVPHADTQRKFVIWRAVWGVRGWGRANGMKHKRNPRAPHAALSEQP